MSDLQNHRRKQADSFKVVMGSTALPEDYTTGIHMIGEKSAVNMTDSRYTYNDDMNGIVLLVLLWREM